MESWSYYAIEPIPTRMQKARAAASEALGLQPDLAEAHLALGELDIARHDLPNDAVLFRLTTAIKRRQGKWEESSANYEKAISLDPKDPILLGNMGWNYIATRDYAKARKVIDRAVEVAPDTSRFENCARG